MLVPSKHSGYQAGIRLYPGSKGGGAPAPDPNIGKYYAKMGDISEEMWQEAKGLLPAQRRQMEQSITAADEATANAKTDRTYALGRQKLMDDRYDTVQTPLEDKLIGLAKGYNEPAEQERMATQAGEDVAGAFRTADGQLQRGLASRGISANSGAAISAINDNSIAAAMAGASAINKTRQAAKDIGWARLGEATALGKGLVGFGQASGQASAAATGQGFQTGTAGTGIIQQGINGVNSAGSTAAGIMGSAAGGLTNLYGQQVAAYNSQQANDPMSTILGSAAGAAGTYGMKALMTSDIRLKTDIHRVGELDNGLSVYTFRYKSGGPITMGVMAHEVEQIVPDAYVAHGADGFHHAVDYGKLASHMMQS